ncbi:uncharacterized protein B0H18DRAFT_1059777 [Fomitopsis serialis]|uniref:uncharacterized protein n=1 Tax=Fomitopsis serialis TaxID=139415 RepID=UPI0020072352|nr:uncharacterized protein B0H18DRAFT_1059777 [Neoantrodia serialis]KAH9911700.1 hypothetical protein B0H18DRAFT_1059777 [Neoantrodia serialis]
MQQRWHTWRLVGVARPRALGQVADATRGVCSLRGLHPTAHAKAGPIYSAPCYQTSCGERVGCVVTCAVTSSSEGDRVFAMEGVG